MQVKFEQILRGSLKFIIILTLVPIPEAFGGLCVVYDDDACRNRYLLIEDQLNILLSLWDHKN